MNTAIVVHAPKTSHPQQPHLQNQAKQKEKLLYPNQRCKQQTTLTLVTKHARQSQHSINPQGILRLELAMTLLTTSHLSRSREKRQMLPQLLKISALNTLKAKRPVPNPRNRNKDPIPKIGQKQSLTQRMTSRINQNDKGRKEERREDRDLENPETSKENREILDGNGDKQPDIQNNGKQLT
ncbi:MAG: hypothetical protein EZS28_018419 [Streblomastix strix]|uniref:Uncharacterized protein n=1 Tax=Streblomastix strix TaxID=222440 RepID=A0A5J4VUM3_9EUKA|nr:MAG: hypothetical protein EZS28_018419 [Streblomastix strix]